MIIQKFQIGLDSATTEKHQIELALIKSQEIFNEISYKYERLIGPPNVVKIIPPKIGLGIYYITIEWPVRTRDLLKD